MCRSVMECLAGCHCASLARGAGRCAVELGQCGPGRSSGYQEA